jgi:hypothetical protein
VPHPESNLASVPLRILLVVGFVAAGVFGVLPLFVPDFFTIFHLHIVTDRFIIRQAGAASLGYTVLAILAQRALNSRELSLTVLMAAIFNGVGGVASIPYIFEGKILLLPWLIAPVGIVVLIACLPILRKAMVTTTR